MQLAPFVLPASPSKHVLWAWVKTGPSMKLPCMSSLAALLFSGLVLVPSLSVSAQAAPASSANTPPAKIQPSATYGTQPTRSSDVPIGLFQGQSDIGNTHLPGGALYDGATKEYTVSSAGYNTVFIRDEFHYLWSKMSGDVSLDRRHRLPRLRWVRRTQGRARHPPEPRR